MSEDRYIEWQLVGRGGTAEVYKVFDQELDCPVAVKLLNDKHRANRELVLGLRREVLISRRLRHPNICPIHDIYEGPRGFGIVMEFIEGSDLRQWMNEKNSRLLATAEDRLASLVLLAEALDVAHTHIVHRDLKPSNVFLRDGDIRRPLILDFGVSVAGQISGDALIAGTPKYMAPEQYENPTSVDRRADLFALGIVAYELMTGGHIPPCSLQHIRATRQVPRVSLSEITPPSHYCAAVPPALDRLIIQLCAYNPGSRPDSARQLLDTLRHIELVSPRTARGPGPAPETTAAVPGGVHYVGSGPDGEHSAEKPMRSVTISEFAIDLTPVTNRDFRVFLDRTGHEAPPFINHPEFGADDRPVVGVTWREAGLYSEWKGGRLPTEIEWECAAKAGDKLRRYPWGNTPPNVSQANIDGVYDATTPVHSYPAGRNTLGLWDVCGNVSEWCSDAWDENYYRKIANGSRDPSNNNESEVRAVRGGSFESFADMGRCSFRHHAMADDRRPDIGFRVVYNDHSSQGER